MLYDKKWDHRVDVHSIDSLISWLETKNPEGTYLYQDYGHCLLGQYYAAMGLYRPEVYSHGIFYHGPTGNRICENYPPEFDSIALHGGRSFGDALKRAKDYQRK